MLSSPKSLLQGLLSYKRHPFLSMRCIGGGWACGDGPERSILTFSQFWLDFRHPSCHAHISTTTWPNFKIQSTREVFETSLMRLKQEMLNKKAITGQEKWSKNGVIFGETEACPYYWSTLCHTFLFRQYLVCI